MTDTLNIITSGLRAAQQQLNVIGQNVANASTEGYTRKVLPQTSVTVANQGAGVITGVLQRTVNTALQNALLQQTSITANYNIQEQYLDRLQSLQGTPDSEQSITATLNKLKNGFASLSVLPNDSLSQAQLVTTAQQFAGQINQLSNSIQSMRNDTQNNIADVVDEVNTQLTLIAKLNTQITSLKGTNQDTTTLEDQRDLALQKVSENINISTFKTDGVIVVQTANGQVLADTVPYPLSFSKTTLSASTTANPITVNGTAIDSYITSGKLGGLINLRDKALPTAQARIDELAEQVAVRFDEQGLKLFTDKAGNVPVSTTPANYIGFSSTIQVNSAVVNDPSLLQKGTTGATTNAGDVTLINSVLDYTFGTYKDAANTAHASFNTTGLGVTGTLATNLTASTDLVNYSTQLISRQAQEYSDIKTNFTTSDTYTKSIAQKLSNDTGVNVDDQMANMILYQQAYNASARMITTYKDLFDKLLSAVGG